jgi:hypothetical protein
VAWIGGGDGKPLEAEIRRWVARKLAGTPPTLEVVCFGGETPELFAKRVEWLALDRGIIRTMRDEGSPKVLLSGEVLFVGGLAELLLDHGEYGESGNTFVVCKGQCAAAALMVLSGHKQEGDDDGNRG